MRKYILFATSALAIFLMAATVFAQPNTALAASEAQHEGLVVAYTEGESITIVDWNGVESMFALASPLKIVPSEDAGLLAVGVYVTIFVSDVEGTMVVQSIVIHSQPPVGFPLLTPLPTQPKDPNLPTSTPLPTKLPMGTPVSTKVIGEEPTERPTKVVPTEVVTETPVGSETPTETAEPTQASGEKLNSQADAEELITSFFEWLASLFSFASLSRG
jgi:hypothetical protein